MIKKETIDQVREQSDIVQVISEYLPLKKAGKYFRTLCPFHNEKSPSFYVSPERQIYHCFGCSAGGSVYTFLMQYEKLPFPEAIRKLAAKAGITIEEEKVYHRNQELYDVCEYAAQFYSDNLQNSKLAIEYLKHRAINSDTIKRFRLGYAPSGNNFYLSAKKQGIKEDFLIKTGLIIKKPDGFHDWFFNRITFPIFSISGKVIGFGARALDSNTEPKYINTPETLIFRKGENLYGLFQAKNYLYQNIPILVEGNFDLLSLVNQGINNVIAPLGTALTNEQALLLRRYTNQVIITFDPDSAGKAATLRTIETLLKVNLDPRITILPEGHDPDKFINKFGIEEFNNIIKNNIDFIDFILQMKDSDSVINKSILLKELLSLISMIDESINQELYINKISEIFKVAKDSLFSQIKKSKKNVSAQTNITNTHIKTLTESQEEQILAILISAPEYIKTVKDFLPVDYFSLPEVKEIVKSIYDNITSNLWTSAEIIDIVDKPELKQKIADLCFRLKSIPTKAEFMRKIQTFKASWYYKAIQDAKATSNIKLLEKLTLEHYNLKRNISKRSTEG